MLHPTSLLLLRSLPACFSTEHPKIHLQSKPLTGSPFSPRSLQARCTPDSEDGAAVSSLVEELLKRDENRVLLDGLEEASRRVDQARAGLADIERQEAEARRAQEITNQLENRVSEIAESQKELGEARAMVEEAQRALSLNMGRSSSDEALSGNINKDLERWESIKAAFISSIIGTVANLPISLYQSSSTGQTILDSIIIFISCALFGVTFRYAIRRDVDNVQLKTGTPAAFGFVRGLTALSARETLEPNIGSLISLSTYGAAYVAENIFIFLSAAVALDFCFKMRVLSPFPVRGDEGDAE